MEDSLEKIISEVRRDQNYTKRVFSTLRKWLKIFHLDLLCNVATLDLNVTTLAAPPSRTSRCCPCFMPRGPHFCPTHAQPCRNPPAPPLLQPPTTVSPLPPPVLAHQRQPYAPVSSLHHNSMTLVWCPNPCSCRLPVSSAFFWVSTILPLSLGLV